VIFADRNSSLQDGAVVDVSAKNGKGGFLEFSAKDTVNMQGNGLRSSAGGTILIDPENIIWTGAGRDVFTNEADYRLEADKRISLTDVVISSRRVAGAGRDAHLTEVSTGNSGNITLKAAVIELTNSDILSFATGTHIAGGITLDAKNEVTLKNTRLDARATDPTKAGNVKITLTGDAVWSYSFGPIDLDIPFSPIAAKFEMDAASLIKGKDVSINVTPQKTAILDFENLTVDQDSIFADLVSGFNDIVNDLVEKGNTKFDEVLGKIFEKLHGKIETSVVEASITINGSIEASKDIVITAVADAKTEIKNSNKGLSWSFSFVRADSEIVIGEYAVIDAKHDVKLSSEAKTTISQTEKAEDADSGIFSNFDVALGLGIALSNNKIDIAKGVSEKQGIFAGNDITIDATTTRSHSLSVSGGNGQSYMGLVVGVLVENADTDVTVGCNLIAGNNVSISAKTDTKDNVVSTMAEMKGKKEDDKKEDDPKKTDNASADALKKSTAGLLSKTVPIDVNTDSGSDKSNKLGAAGAVSVTVDNVDTNVTISGSAKITAGTNPDSKEGNVKISAETINEVMSSAFAHIGEYKVEGENTTKAKAIAFSTPLVFMNNSTTAVVKSDTTVITARGDIDITAETRIPFNQTHPIYSLFDSLQGKSTGDEDDIGEKLKEFVDGFSDEYFGLTKLLNTWGQSSAKTNEIGGAAMLTYLDINNTTIAQIEGGTFTASNLKIDAKTNVGLANFVGSFASIAKNEKPKEGDSGATPIKDEKLEKLLATPLLKMPKKDWDKVYEYGRGLKSDGSTEEPSGLAMGAAVLLTSIDSTTIARIDGGVLNISVNPEKVNETGKITVNAETQVVDIGIAIGKGNAGSFGADIMANASFYDSYTLAKIDDSVKVTAKDVLYPFTVSAKNWYCIFLLKLLLFFHGNERNDQAVASRASRTR